MTLYVSGSLVVKGEEYYCGEIAQAAKNLFVWRRYAYPASVENLNSGNRPPIVESGRCKKMSQAEHKLMEASKEIVDKLKALKAIVMEEPKENSEIKLETV